MSKFNNTHTFTAAAFGAVALFSMLSFGSSAEASQNLSSCQGKTSGAVVSCCEKLTEAQRPMWMIQSRMSCNQIVVCGGKKSSDRRCFVRIVTRILEKGDGNPGRSSEPHNEPKSLR